MTHVKALKTFVAPAVGGPKDGELICAPEGIESWMMMEAGDKGPTWIKYALVRDPQGNRVWVLFEIEHSK